MSKKFAAFAAQLSLLILLLMTVASPGVPQNPAKPPDAQTQRPRKVYPNEQEPEDIVRFDTDLVSVDVTAMDTSGRPVKNLKPEDFKLFSDGVERDFLEFNAGAIGHVRRAAQRARLVVGER